MLLNFLYFGPAFYRANTFKVVYIFSASCFSVILSSFTDISTSDFRLKIKKKGQGIKVYIDLRRLNRLEWLNLFHYEKVNKRYFLIFEVEPASKIDKAIFYIAYLLFYRLSTSFDIARFYIEPDTVI